MRFEHTGLSGVYLIEVDRLADVRGFFARTYCQREFEVHRLEHNSVQCNISFNCKRGTIRGMHFQRYPNAEAKLVRCTIGAIFDVVIDLRKDSLTYLQWKGFKLTAANRSALYIPQGFAHGFQTLMDNTEVFYQMFNFYTPESAGGVRWNDPVFGIEWPLSEIIISDKDRLYPDFDGISL